jgi:hypothetical protein
MTYSDRVFAQGKAEGRAEGQRDILLKQLALKFGALDDAVVARVRAAEPASLEIWLERFAVATQLDSIFES